MGMDNFFGFKKNTKGKHCKDNNDEKRMFAFFLRIMLRAAQRYLLSILN